MKSNCYTRIALCVFVAVCCLGHVSHAQLNVLTSDTTICTGDSVWLVGSGATRTPNLVTLADDLYSPTVNFGFPFKFYGNTYTKCVISSNGYISFDTTVAGTFSNWEIPVAALPNATATYSHLQNAIMVAAADLYPNNAGDIDWTVQGTAPNRKLIVTWCNMNYFANTPPAYTCGNNRIAMQAVLYESSNVIDMQINRKDSCGIWQGARAIQAVQNINGTKAATTPGRGVPLPWAAYLSGRRYTPTSDSTYSIDSIGYNFISRVAWYKNDIDFISTDTAITVFPTTNTFYVFKTDCADNFADSIHVTVATPRIYVDSSMAVSGTGASWASPVKTLREALTTANAATCTNEIWVKSGTYFPTSGTSRDSSFRILRNGIKVYGGFAGGETSLSQRNPTANPTVLSGEIGTPDTSDNSHHVMTIVGNPSNNIDTNTVVDGFTITRGNAVHNNGIMVSGMFVYRGGGGGINCAGLGAGSMSSPLLQNITFVSNYAQWGGGLYAQAHTSGKSSPLLRNCTFLTNFARGEGGGFQGFTDGTGGLAAPTFVSCVFNGNKALSRGGALYLNHGAGGSGSLTVRSCSFINNQQTNISGSEYGGAILLNGGSMTASIKNSTFTGNSANAGSAILAIGSGPVNLDSNDFTGNQAIGFGLGTVLYFAGASGAVTNSNFSLNKGATGGGVENSGSATVSLVNCTFSQDSVTNSGAAIRNSGGGTMHVTDCKMLNEYGAASGAAYNGSGTLNFLRCIFSGNKTQQLGGALNNNAGNTIFTNCVLEGNASTTNPTPGGGTAQITAGSVTFNNSTLSNNTAASTSVPGGSAIAVNAGAALNLRNTIVWGGAAQQVSGAGNTNYQHSIIRGVSTTPPNYNLDPFFVNPADPDGADNVWATADDGLRLSPCSPALNGGNNTLISTGITTDLTGAARIQLAIVDMGAYEHNTNGVGLPDVTIAANANPVCAGSNVTFTATATNGGTASYQWFHNNNAAGINAATFATNTLANNDTVWVVLTNTDCGLTDTSNRIVITVNPAPSPAGVISGPDTVCPGVTQTYSVGAVSGATSYTWSLPSGWSGTSNSNSIAVTTGASNGTIGVTATNTCGTSAASSLAVNFYATVGTMGPISGPASVCAGAAQTYSIAPVAAATSYTWSVPSGWTGSTTTSVPFASFLPSATGGNVTVVATNACGASPTSTLTVSSMEAPAQPGAITGPVSPCAGSSQTYSVPLSTVASAYNWTLPADWIATSSTNSNSITVTVGAALGNISVTAANSCGTSTASTLSVAPLSIPVSSAAITGTAAPCAGTQTQYSVAAVAGATSYTWTLPPNWLGSSATNTITATAVAPLGGAVTVVASNVCGSSAPQTLSVGLSHIPSQPGAIMLPVAVCSAAAGAYSVAPVTGATSYVWSFPSGWAGGGTTAISSTAATPGNSGVISVVAANACGISAPSTAVATVESVPMQPSAIFGPSPVCAGSVNVYTVAPIANATAFNWTLPSDWSGTSLANSISAIASSTAGSGTIAVNASNACGISPSTMLPVSVNALTPTSLAITPSTPSNAVCAGVPVTFTATAAGSGTAPTFEWTRNNTTQISQTGPTFTVNNLTSGDVIGLTMTSNAVCPSPAIITATPLTMTVLQNVIPGININTQFATAPVICTGTPLNFVANTVGGGTTPQYQWLRNGQPVGTNAPTYSAASWTNGDVVQATLTSNAQCASPLTVNSNAVVVTVNPVITPAVSVFAVPSNVFSPGVAITFTAAATGGGAAPIYQWFRNSQPIIGGVGPTYTTTNLTGGDSVWVRLTSSDPCALPAVVFSEKIVVRLSTSAPEIYGENSGVYLYPNPNKGRFTISVIGSRAGLRTVVEVLNAIGQRVYLRQIITERKDWSLPIELADVANGIYLLRLVDEAGNKSAMRFEVKE